MILPWLGPQIFRAHVYQTLIIAQPAEKNPVSAPGTDRLILLMMPYFYLCHFATHT